MKPTRRGLFVLGVIGFSIAMAAGWGPRALNAVVVPLVIVGIAAVVTVARTDEPTIDRRPVTPGFVGEMRTVELVIETDRPTVATLVDAVGDGLDRNRYETACTLDGDTVISYDVELTSRGETTVGPTTVAVTDLFGLVRRQFETNTRDSVLVYPPVYTLHGEVRRSLTTVCESSRAFDRSEFDHLREYERGDALRDVHWKSAAKRPADELIVTEYTGAETFDRVSVAAESADGLADEMAAATATVAAYLFRVGIGVDLATPYGASVTTDTDSDEVYALLATVEAGSVGEQRREQADVVVRTTPDGTVLEVGEGRFVFDRVRSSNPVIPPRGRHHEPNAPKRRAVVG